jgi:hypothetical protein
MGSIKIGGPSPSKREAFAGRYFRAAQAYMLISIPTGTSTIFGVFHAILALLANGTTFSFLAARLTRIGKFTSKIFSNGPNAVIAMQQF